MRAGKLSPAGGRLQAIHADDSRPFKRTMVILVRQSDGDAGGSTEDLTILGEKTVPIRVNDID